MSTALIILPWVNRKRYQDVLHRDLIRILFLSVDKHDHNIRMMYGLSGVIFLPERSDMLADMKPLTERDPMLWTESSKELKVFA